MIGHVDSSLSLANNIDLSPNVAFVEADTEYHRSSSTWRRDTDEVGQVEMQCWTISTTLEVESEEHQSTNDALHISTCRRSFDQMLDTVSVGLHCIVTRSTRVQVRLLSFGLMEPLSPLV